jgi:hypothetical protein
LHIWIFWRELTRLYQQAKRLLRIAIARGLGGMGTEKSSGCAR